MTKRTQNGQYLAAMATMIFLGASALEAQACVGLPSQAVTPRMVSTTGAGTNLGRTVVARYGMTGARFFGGAQLGVAGQKFAALRAPVYGGDVGMVISLGASGATQLCPVLQSVYQHGPNGSSYTSNRLATSLGVSLGHAIGLSRSVAVVPFIQGGVQHLRQGYGYTSVGVQPNGEPGLGGWGHRNNVFGEAALGFGLRLNEHLTISPSYRIPVGLGSRTKQYQIINGAMTVPRPSLDGVYQQTYSVSVTLGFPRR